MNIDGVEGRRWNNIQQKQDEEEII